MNRLTDRSYWDTVNGEPALAAAPALPTPFRKWLRHIGRSYAAEHFWSRCLGHHLKPGQLRIIEIGSAPGDFLKECHARFGFEPYGVEYSPVGARVNRENFKSWGLDPNHVMQSDLFTDDFQSAHRGQFDVVVSRGFIEHFIDLEPVIDAHVNLLKSGGTLVISIPNLSGLNYVLGMLTSRAVYPLHNMDIMRVEVFGRLFARSELDTLFCGYQGGIDLGILEAGPHTTLINWVRNVNRLAQWGLNVVFNALCFGLVPETRYTSPYLLYIGRKKAA
jgi:SAM-dependent methyltransferase